MMSIRAILPLETVNPTTETGCPPSDDDACCPVHEDRPYLGGGPLRCDAQAFVGTACASAVGLVTEREQRSDGLWLKVLPAYSESAEDPRWVRQADVRGPVDV
jgi:hypothetical protein